MHANNVVVVRGVAADDPRQRELPSGDVVTQFDVTTRGEGLTTSVPVVVHGAQAHVAAGDGVVVVGHVNRRFFRVGGVTQSRTEVVADQVCRATQRRTIERALAAASAMLTGGPGGLVGGAGRAGWSGELVNRAAGSPARFAVWG